MHVHSQRGYSIAELLIVVMAVLGIGLATLLWSLNSQAGARTQASVAMVRTAMQDLKALRPDRNYSGITEAELIRAGKVPEAWQRGGGTTIQGPWGGRFYLEAWHGFYSNTLAHNGIALVVQSLDRPTCIALVQSLYPNTYGIINYNYASTWIWLAGTTARPDPAVMEAACNMGNNTTLWIYYMPGRL